MNHNPALQDTQLCSKKQFTMTVPFANSFTQAWIQALMQAADIPAARTIKSKLEWIDTVSQDRPDQDRLAAAKELWSFAEAEGLLELLKIVPTAQATWVFAQDDIFTYQARKDSAANKALDFDRWTEAIGLRSGSFELTAEVTAGDWSELVRIEAVRLKQKLNTTAVSQTTSMKHLPCTARWKDNLWTVQFDPVDWIHVNYEDFVSIPRPCLEVVEEPIAFTMAHAHDSVLVKNVRPCDFRLQHSEWMDCVARLMPIHQMILSNSRDFSPWFTRVWDCVWPVIYREQNMLNGKADLNRIRSEIKECLTTQPRLTVWMFLFAKLSSLIMVGRGLGQCADFIDT
jgi:hypothetical protein